MIKSFFFQCVFPCSTELVTFLARLNVYREENGIVFIEDFYMKSFFFIYCIYIYIYDDNCYMC